MKKYRDFALEFSAQAAKIIKSNFSLGMEKQWKKDASPVTLSDLAINRLLIESVKDTFPDHAVLGEEASNVFKTDYIWVCDPIDGTVPFSHAFPISTCSLALTIKGESVLGIVVDPFMDRTVVAEKGQGAFLNGKPITVSDSKSLDKTVIDIEWNNSLLDLSPVKRELNNQGCSVVTLSSTVYSGMLVACGEFSGLIFGNQTPWDGAAVKIIVEEAGGKVTDIFGHEQSYTKDINGFIASNKILHDQLLTIIKQKVEK